MLKFISTISLSLLLFSCSSQQNEPTTLPVVRGGPEPKIAAPAVHDNSFKVGDTLELFVKEDATLNGSYLVREGGYIVIPRAGRISVAGQTRATAEAAVQEILQKTQLTAATVIVERTPQAGDATGFQQLQSMPKILIYVTGRVTRSGGHMIPIVNGRRVGVYEALLITGGLARFAQPQKVEVLRNDNTGKRHRAVIDLKPIMEGKAEDPPIEEGDIIHVPERVFGF